MHFHTCIYMINICVYLFLLSYLLLSLSLATVLGYNKEQLISW